MRLYEGRPADARERLEKERRTYDLLDSLGIGYWRTDHAPAGNIAQCREIDAVLDTVICKNLFLCDRQETQFNLLMMPGDKVFKTKGLLIPKSRGTYGKNCTFEKNRGGVKQ